MSKPNRHFPFLLGPYKILKKIGQGGMGEVFLAYDSDCKRFVALKSILSLKSHGRKKEPLLKRLKKEAHLTASLNHPNIIPIYSVHEEGGSFYYTMPYIQDPSLKDRLTLALKNEEQGEICEHHHSVAFFAQAFFEICRAISLAHQAGIIHSDIKPSNIFIGPHAEVRILDWGLIQTIKSSSKRKRKTTSFHLAGTPSYLAPELASGMPASIQSDIYSLGLIFYEMLTLRFPFHRSNMDEYYDNFPKEILPDPAIIAPQREIPQALSRICLKCLEPSLACRYQSVEEIILELEACLQGRKGWCKAADFSLSTLQKTKHFPSRKNSLDYLLSEHIFSDSLMLECQLKIEDEDVTIGFFFGSSPKASLPASREMLFSANPKEGMRVRYREGEELSFPYLNFSRGKWSLLQILKVETSIYVYLDGTLEATMVDYVPRQDGHFGICFNKQGFSLKEGKVFLWGLSAKSGRLVSADILFAYRQYYLAAEEYRKIAEEGFTKRALFRSGLSLLFDAKTKTTQAEKMRGFRASIQTFKKLSLNSMAPLDALGCSLVYEAQGLFDKELKYLEEGLESASYRPFFSILIERIFHRVHADCTARCFNPELQGHLFLLILKYKRLEELPVSTRKYIEEQMQFYHLDCFIEEGLDLKAPLILRLDWMIRLACFLGKKNILLELIDQIFQMEPGQLLLLENALFALIGLGEKKVAAIKLDKIFSTVLDVQAAARLNWIREVLLIISAKKKRVNDSFYRELPNPLTPIALRPISFLIKFWTKKAMFSSLEEFIGHLPFAAQQEEVACKIKGNSLN